MRENDTWEVHELVCIFQFSWCQWKQENKKGGRGGRAGRGGREGREGREGSEGVGDVQDIASSNLPLSLLASAMFSYHDIVVLSLMIVKKILIFWGERTARRGTRKFERE